VDSRPELVVVRLAAHMVRGCAVASLIAWSATADAFMGYPPVVDTWLAKDGLVEKFEPPMGCQLCHVSDIGGTVELKPFGNMLVATYGLSKAVMEDTVLMGALAELKATNPMLYADMQKGIDPNTDPALTAHELPQPEYGCSAGAAPNSPRWSAILLAIVSLAAGLRRPRRAMRR
jgi:hypothetical protein